MNKLRLLFGLALSAFFLTAPSFAETKIKIGISTALTGNAASWGEDIRNALLFSNDELAGGKYEFAIEDDACNGKNAVTAAHKLVDIEKVKYVLGFACSSAVPGAASIYDAAKVIAISSSASTPAVSQAGDYIFRTWPSDLGAAQKLYAYLAKHVKVLGVISEETDYAQGLLRAISSQAEGGGLKIVNENFLTEDTDYKSLLARLRSKNIDALFINSQTDITLLTVLKQVRDLHFKQPIYGAYFPGSRTFLDQAGAAANGIIYVDGPNAEDVLTPEGQAVLKRFEEKYGKPKCLPMVIATTFESFRALNQAIQSGDDPLHYLNATKFHGIFGDWWFDKNGDIQGLNFVMKRIVNGNPQLIEE